MSAIEQAKSDSNDDCESSNDSLQESKGKHGVVVMGIVAVVEAARLVRGHRHCGKFGGYVISVFVLWKQLFELDSRDNVGIVCNGVKYSSSVGVLEALSSAPTSTVRPFNYASKRCRQCRRCREAIMRRYSTL